MIDTDAVPPGTSGDQEPSRADLRRRRIVDAAQALFATHGFHGTGIAQIAATSGVRVGQIYRDFASKEEIVAQIVDDGLNALLDDPGLHAAIAGRNGEAVRNWIIDMVLRKAHPDQSPLLPEIYAEAGRNARIAAVLAGADRRVRESLLSALAVFLPLSTPREEVAASTDLIMTMMAGLCSRRAAGLHGNCAGLTDSIHQVIDGAIARLADPGPVRA